LFIHSFIHQPTHLSRTLYNVRCNTVAHLRAMYMKMDCWCDYMVLKITMYRLFNRS